MAADMSGVEGLVAPGAELEKVATGCVWSEGPLWVPSTGTVRWSDIPGNRIMAYDPATGETAVHRDQVEFTNGRALMPDGSVVQCSHGRRQVEVETDGVVRTLVDSWAGGRLNSPNDVVVRSDGTVWFTDPTYGITQPAEGHPGEMEYGDCHVFCFDPATEVLTSVVTDAVQPNGLAFSPDERLLYVSDTEGERPDGTGNHHIRTYEVVPGRVAVKNGRTFAVISPGASDGFKVDSEGRIWTSSADAVQIFAPDGERLGSVPVPEVIANLCFGGPDGHDLYVAASTSLYRIRTLTRDATWPGES